MAETIGELKKALAGQGGLWTVDPRLDDGELFPDLPRGGQNDEDIPESDRLTFLEKDLDINELLSKQPPDNPWLREHWIKSGLLKNEDGDARVPMDVDREFGPS